MSSGGRKSWSGRAALALCLTLCAVAAKAQSAAPGGAAAPPNVTAPGGTATAAGPTVALDIGRAQELARKNADEVLAKEAAASAALRAVDAARANFFPKLGASLSGSYLPQPPAGVTVAAGSLSTFPIKLPAEDLTIGGYTTNSYFKGSINFMQPIVTWGKIKAAVDLASLEARVAEIGSAGAQLDAVRSANRAYYSAVLSRESVAILTELRVMAASILEDRKSALTEGFSTKEDVLSSAADLAALETKLVQAGESEASALESLGLLTGLDASAIDLVSGYRTALPTLFEEQLKSEASQASTEVSLAREKLAEARKNLDLKRDSSLFLPDLSLFATAEASGQTVPFSSATWWSGTWNWDVSIGLAANVDFLDGGASAAKTAEAAASLDAARIAAGAAEKGARLRVRQAIDAARGAEASLKEKQARAAWAAEALRNARVKAADQAASRAELNAKAIGDATARLDLAYARYALEQSIADLERIAGKEMK